MNVLKLMSLFTLLLFVISPLNDFSHYSNINNKDAINLDVENNLPCELGRTIQKYELLVKLSKLELCSKFQVSELNNVFNEMSIKIKELGNNLKDIKITGEIEINYQLKNGNIIKQNFIKKRNEYNLENTSIKEEENEFVGEELVGVVKVYLRNRKYLDIIEKIKNPIKKAEYYALAKAYEALGKKEESAKYYLKLGECAENEGNKERAKKIYLKSIEVCSQNEKGYKKLVNILREEWKIHEAVKILELGIENNKNLEQDLNELLMIRDLIKKKYEEIIDAIRKNKKTDVKCFLSYIREKKTKEFVFDMLKKDLERAGINVCASLDNKKVEGNELIKLEDQIRTSNYVLVMCDPYLKTSYDNYLNKEYQEITAQELQIINEKMLTVESKGKIIPLLYEGEIKDSMPYMLESLSFLDYRDIEHYNVETLKMIGRITGLDIENKITEFENYMHLKIRSQLTKEDIREVEIWRKNTNLLNQQREAEKKDGISVLKIPSVTELFTGRNDEIESLSTLLRKDGSRVLVTHKSGLVKPGKSELVKKYVEEKSKTYDRVIWLRGEELDAEEIIRAIGQGIRKEELKLWLEKQNNWLLVIDNAEDKKSVEPYMPSKGCRVIITSRNIRWPQDIQKIELDVFKRKDSIAYLIKATKQQDDNSADSLAELLSDNPISLLNAVKYILRLGIQMGAYESSKEAEFSKTEIVLRERKNNVLNRNKNFTGRELELTKLEDILGNAVYGAVRIASNIGLGGVGKTQLTLQYIFRNASKYKFVWWFNAEDKYTLDSGYLDFAEKAGIYISDDDKKNNRVTQKVIEWLQHTRNSGWLLVYDNAEDSETLNTYIPKAGGHVIITSRNSGWEGMSEVMKVDVFKRVESKRYIEKITGIKDKEMQNKLAEELGDLPLALTQASAYIKETGISIDEYLELYKKQRLELQEEEHAPKEEKYKYTVQTTWDISMKQIEKEEQKNNRTGMARLIMGLCSYISPNDIPRWLLANYLGKENSSREKYKLLDEQETFKLLHKYSMIDSNLEKGTINIHRLVQMIVRDNIKKVGKEEKTITNLKEFLNAEFKYDYWDDKTWSSSQELVNHVVELSKYETSNINVNIEQAKLLGRVSHLLFEIKSDLKLAEQVVKRFLDYIEKQLGTEKNLPAGICYKILAEIYGQKSLGSDKEKSADYSLRSNVVLGSNYMSDEDSYFQLGNTCVETDKALGFYQKALEIRRAKKHPEDSIPFGEIYFGIGRIYHEDKFDFKKALDYYQKALNIEQKKLGAHHLQVLKIKSKIAEIYEEQNDYDKALEYYNEKLKVQKEKLEQGHPEIAKTYSDIARIYLLKREFDKALENYNIALKMYTDKFGNFGIGVLDIHANISQIYFEKYGCNEALKYIENIIMQYRNMLDQDKYGAINCYEKKGAFLIAKSEYDKALECFDKARDSRRNIWKTDAKIAVDYNYIGNIYRFKGDYKEALRYYKSALSVIENFSGEQDKIKSEVYSNISDVYIDKGKYNKALEFAEKALKICTQKYGEKNIKTQLVLIRIASICAYKGEFDKAIQYYKNAEKIVKEKLGDKNEYLSKIYYELGVVYNNQGFYNEALSNFQKALEIQISISNENHAGLSKIYNCMGEVYFNQAKYKEALEYFKKALYISINKFGTEDSPHFFYIDSDVLYSTKSKVISAPEIYEKTVEKSLNKFASIHPDIAEIYNNIGKIYKVNSNFNEAIEIYEKTLSIQNDVFRGENVKTAITYENLGRVYYSKGQYDIAFKKYEKALKINIQYFGENHINTASNYNNIGLVYCAQKEFDKALEYFEKALKIWFKCLGENHPNIAFVYNNIGQIYNAKGNYNEALKYFNMALKISLEKLGDNHPEIAKIYKNIGMIYECQNNFNEALKYYEKALNIKSVFSDDNNNETADILNSMGLFYKKNGNYIKAIECLVKCFRIRTLTLGANNSLTLDVKKNLDLAVQELKNTPTLDFNEVLETYAKLLDMWKENLEKNDVRFRYKELLVENFKDIGNLYDLKNNYTKALEYYLRSFKILGENYVFIEYHRVPAPMKTLMDEVVNKIIAKIISSDLNPNILDFDLNKSLSYYEESLHIWKNNFSKDSYIDTKTNVEFVKNYTNMALLYLFKHNYVKSMQYFINAFDVLIDNWFPNDKDTANLIIYLDNVLANFIKICDGNNRKVLEYCRTGIKRLQLGSEQINKKVFTLSMIEEQKKAFEDIAKGKEDVREAIKIAKDILKENRAELIKIGDLKFESSDLSKAVKEDNEEKVKLLPDDSLGKEQEKGKDKEIVQSNTSSSSSIIINQDESKSLEEILLGNESKLKDVKNNIGTRNKTFILREPEIEKMEKTFSNALEGTCAIASIMGVDGVGRKELTLQYIYKNLLKYKIIWWFNSESEYTLKNGYLDFAQKMGIPISEQDLKQGKAIDNIMKWLSRTENSARLFIFENVNDPEELKKYLPKTKGHVIIISGCRIKNPTLLPYEQEQEAQKRLKAISEVLELGIFKREESKKFIKNITGSDDNDMNNQLADALGDLPIALNMACVYIKEIGISIGDYLQLYNTKRGVSHKEEHGPREEIYEHTIQVILDICFSHIEEKESRKGLARLIMTLCAYINSNNMPKWLLEICNHNGSSNNKSYSEEQIIINLLKKYLIIDMNIDNHTIRMHKILQNIIKNKIQKSNKQELEFFEKNLELWVKECGENYDDISSVYKDMAKAFDQQDNYDKSLEYFEKALNIKLALGREDKSEISDIIDNIGLVCARKLLKDKKGDLKIFEYLTRALKNGILQLGANHPAILRVEQCFGLMGGNITTCPKEIIENYEKTINMWRESLTNDTLTIQHKTLIANHYLRIGSLFMFNFDFIKALEYILKALKICEGVLYRNDQFIQMVKNSMDMLIMRIINFNMHMNPQFNLAKTLEYYEEGVDIWKNKFSENTYGMNPVMKTMFDNNNKSVLADNYTKLGTLYMGKSDYVKSTYYFSEAFKISIDLSGENSQFTINLKMYLDNVLSNLMGNFKGDYKKALENYESAMKKLKINIQALGMAYHNLGYVYYYYGDYTKAIEYYEISLNYWTKAFGSKSLQVAGLYMNMSLSYKSLKKYDTALDYLIKALDIRKNILGEKDVNTAMTYSDIGIIYYLQNKDDDALRYFELALNIVIEKLGDKHKNISVIYNNIAEVYEDQGKYDKAIEYLEKSYNIIQDIETMDHIELLKKKNSDDKMMLDQAYNKLKSGNYEMNRMGLCQISKDIATVIKIKKITVEKLLMELKVLKTKLTAYQGNTKMFYEGEYKYEQKNYADGMVVLIKYKNIEEDPIDMEIIEFPVIDEELITKILGENNLVKTMTIAKEKIKDRIDYIRRIVKPLYDTTLDIGALEIVKYSSYEILRDDIQIIRHIKIAS
jgi:tetratricopeptide (TPR) repeat protein